MSSQKKFHERYSEALYYMSLLGVLGFTIIFNILFFIALYKFIIERYLIANTFLFITMTLVGVVSGFYNAYKLLIKKSK